MRRWWLLCGKPPAATTLPSPSDSRFTTIVSHPAPRKSGSWRWWLVSRRVSFKSVPRPRANSMSGWVDAIAVAPAHRRRGLGGQLLVWGEAWLAGQGCRRARLGGSLRPYVPGLPESLGQRPFFEQRRYRFDRIEWDVARSLADFGGLHPVPPGASARPAQANDLAELDAFLLREFPGRWRFELQEFLREAGRPTDYFLLWVDEPWPASRASRLRTPSARSIVSTRTLCRVRGASSARWGSQPVCVAAAMAASSSPPRSTIFVDRASRAVSSTGRTFWISMPCSAFVPIVNTRS